MRKELITCNKAAEIIRIEPETKEKAEKILNQLGVSSSVVINMLYKQIILTNSIPFPLSIPSVPPARDEITDEQFKTMILTSLEQIRSGQYSSAEDVFSGLRKEL